MGVPNRRRHCAALALSLTGLIGAGAPTDAPTPTPPIVGRMGIVMRESAARHGIAFRPFTPPRTISAAALLPPFHGADVRENRGIGFEYVGTDGHRYALAQWPANGGSIMQFPPLNQAEPDCAQARKFFGGTTRSGIVWSTTQGLIMTLQADGASDARTLEQEWRKLIRRGACR